MAWLIFVVSSILLVLAATKLAEYGEVIAVRTRLGGLFVGTLLLAGATSLPELLTTISSVNQGAPNLAAGNLLGSCMINMLVLALLDLIDRQARILRRVAMRHALSAGLAILLLGMTAFFLLADIGATIGWVGVDSLLLVATYVVGMRLVQSNNLAGSGAPEAVGEIEGVPTLRRGLIGFAGAAAVLVVVTPSLVSSS
jgi:cation:H+ antiporter